MTYATGDAVVVMDVDLQDPPELIREMIAKWREAFDVVYAQRRNRAGESRRQARSVVPGLQAHQSHPEVNIPPNTGDLPPDEPARGRRGGPPEGGPRVLRAWSRSSASARPRCNSTVRRDTQRRRNYNRFLAFDPHRHEWRSSASRTTCCRWMTVFGFVTAGVASWSRSRT